MKANWRRSQAAPHLGRVAFKAWEEGIQYNKVTGEISFDA